MAWARVGLGDYNHDSESHGIALELAVMVRALPGELPGHPGSYKEINSS